MMLYNEIILTLLLIAANIVAIGISLAVIALAVILVLTPFYWVFDYFYNRKEKGE